MFVKKSLEDLVIDWTEVGKGEGETHQLSLGFWLVRWARCWCHLLTMEDWIKVRPEKEDDELSLIYRIDYRNWGPSAS